MSLVSLHLLPSGSNNDLPSTYYVLSCSCWKHRALAMAGMVPAHKIFAIGAQPILRTSSQKVLLPGITIYSFKTPKFGLWFSVI